VTGKVDENAAKKWRDLYDDPSSMKRNLYFYCDLNFGNPAIYFINNSKPSQLYSFTQEFENAKTLAPNNPNVLSTWIQVEFVDNYPLSTYSFKNSKGEDRYANLKAQVPGSMVYALSLFGHCVYDGLHCWDIGTHYTENPDFFYDLDEYTQMNSIQEILVEFVKGVKRRKERGINMLYTLNPETRKYSNWPALVLLDGMPVYNIDEILAYDSHLVRYVQIYHGRFFFGASCCEGVISFVTRGGRLSNYKLDAGSHLMSYCFPQDHPSYVNHTGNMHATLLWQPCVEAEAVTFKTPQLSGRYMITIQGLDKNKNPYRYQSEFFVK